MSEEEVPCGSSALFRYTWPGREELFCCLIHANQILAVAENIGLTIQMISDGLALENECSSFIKK